MNSTFHGFHKLICLTNILFFNTTVCWDGDKKDHLYYESKASFESGKQVLILYDFMLILTFNDAICFSLWNIVKHIDITLQHITLENSIKNLCHNEICCLSNIN